MNKTRKKELDSIVCELNELQLRLETVRDDEQEAYDNLPEGLQESDRGCQMEENVDDLDLACSDLEDVINAIQAVIDNN